MNVDRQAEIVKQPAQRSEHAAKSSRAIAGKKSVERYLERLLDAARRLHRGPEASELLCAAAELFEGTIEDDPSRATQLYGEALDAFVLSRPAHLGLRRIARKEGDIKSTVAALDREIAAATGKRSVALRVELARTLLYQADKPSEALNTLERLEDERIAAAVAQGEHSTKGASSQVPAWMGMDVFFLWEEALWATGQWRRYEELLRGALAQRHAADGVAQMIERRLLHLYQYMLPDTRQARMIIDHLIDNGALDPELVEFALRRLEKEEKQEDMVDLLTRALAHPDCADRETTYRMMLADLARHHYQDAEHAADILATGLENHPSEPILIHELLSLQEERGDARAILDALGSSLEILTRPSDRADVLHRIGSILLDELELDESAEEVFVEALAEEAAHRPTLRALGRIYHARQDWQALAGLYEGELAAGPCDDSWRKHFQLAELYEERIVDAHRAFTEYASVLRVKPAYLPALKGASRLAAQLGNWTSLLELYAEAEGATEDLRQRTYLLERIAQIAEEHLDDQETARMALEGLRVVEPRHPGALASLARLYTQLGYYEELVGLTDEELQWTTDDETAAALAVRNGEICEEYLDADERAEGYYRRALDRIPTFLPALEGLGRLLQRQARWADLVEMGLREVDAWGASPEAARRLHAVADILERHLGEVERATQLYWQCIETDANDRVARGALVRLYRAAGDWERVCEILELEAEHGSSGAFPGATLFRIGQIKEHRLKDDDGALDAYRRAFLSDPGHPVLMRAWLSMARKLDALDEPKRILATASAKPGSTEARTDLLLTLAEFQLRETHDPLTAAGYLEIVLQVSPKRETAATLLAIAYARSGRWADRLAIALEEHRVDAERQHGCDGALVLGMRKEHANAARDVVARLHADDHVLLNTWSLLTPGDRPSFHRLPKAVRTSLAPEAQDLRRWAAIRALVDGEVRDPSRVLLPEESEHHLTLRPDMELLASHYETGEAWSKLLEVLKAQEDMAPTDEELVRTILERASVLQRLHRDDEALAIVRDAFAKCSIDADIREALYVYLETAGDWQRLIAELRSHLMKTEDPAVQSTLWKRLSHALEFGTNDLGEALRALDAAYRAFPGDGAMLTEIARVAEGLGEVAIARRAMDDYLAYHQPGVEAEIAAAKRLVVLHIDEPGGSPEHVIAYLDTLSERSAYDREVLDALADAHAKAGDPLVAVDALLRLARLPYREEEVSYWLRLADLYAHALGEHDKAEALLWEMLQHFPRHDGVWNAIDTSYAGTEGRKALSTQLRSFVDADGEHALDAPTRRHFLTILARIVGDELGGWREAQEIYAEAIDLAALPAPKKQDAEELAPQVDAEELARRRAYAMCRIPGERGKAYEGFCDLLVENPFQPDILRAAIDLAENESAWDRARILRQVAKLFVPQARLHMQDVALRPKIVVTRELADGTLEKQLLHPSLRSLYEVLHEALPMVETVFKDRIPKAADISGNRLKGRSEAGELFNTVASRLNLGNVRIFLGNDESPEPMVFANPNAFWIPNDRWQAMDITGQRHWAGYAAGLLWTGLAPLVYLEGREIWQLIDGIHYAATGDGIEGRTAYTIEAAEKVKSAWYRRARKEVATLVKEARASIHSDQADRWADWLKGTGDRAGLLFSGDLETSVRAMLDGEGWRAEELDEKSLRVHLERFPRVRELIAFALSNDYLNLRHAAGLSQRPSALNG